MFYERNRLFLQVEILINISKNFLRFSLKFEIIKILSLHINDPRRNTFNFIKGAKND